MYMNKLAANIDEILLAALTPLLSPNLEDEELLSDHNSSEDLIYNSEVHICTYHNHDVHHT